MTEIERIKDQMSKAFKGEAWHGPAMLESLAGVSAKQASAKPIPNAHSIWEIVLHVTATYELVIGRMHGDPVVLTPEQDWPTVGETGDHAWGEAIDKLKRVHSQLLELVSSLSDARLNDDMFEGFSTFYTTFHGMAQHDVYHAGQIALLKK